MITTALATALSTVFGSTLTSATNVYAKNGSTNGLISTSNLASVLGVGANGFSQDGGSLTSSSDLNNKPKGCYTINTATGYPSNMPSGYGTSHSFVFLGFGASWGLQVLVDCSNATVFLRAHFSSSFGSWRTI